MDTPQDNNAALGAKVLLALIVLIVVLIIFLPHYVAYYTRVVADAEHYRLMVLHACQGVKK